MKKINFMFEKFNPNPLGRKDACDCVIRAICKITGMSWVEVYDELYQYGLSIGGFGNEKEVYSAMLKDKGYEFHAIKREKSKRACCVEQFCKEHPKGSYILRLAHHLTAVVDGVCYDTWYPQGCSVYGYWTKEE